MMTIVTARCPVAKQAMTLPTPRSRASAFESLKPKAHDIGHIDQYSSVCVCLYER